MMSSIDAVRGYVQRWDEGAWCLAALAVAYAADRDDEQARAARRVMQALGMAPDGEHLDGAARTRLAAQAKAPLLQISALLSGERSWLEQSDEALLAQGRSSAQAAVMFEQLILPRLSGLAARFDQPDCRMLDVGTGVGALALAYAEAFPQLTVVGIDVLPRVLALAAGTISRSPAGARVELRQQDICELDDHESYDLVWVPAPFIPTAALAEGMPRLRQALRPGGWLMLGHGKFGDSTLENALNVFKTLAYGGTPLEDKAAEGMLASVGLVEIATLPTPPGAPVLTVGRAGPGPLQ
jgi:SAM-dependent methyltransferase